MTVHAIPVPPDEPEHLVFDVNQFEWGELEEMETIVGRDVFKELSRGEPSVKTLIAMIYVVKKRTNPAYTLDDARKVRVNSVTFDTPNDPKEQAD